MWRLLIILSEIAAMGNLGRSTRQQSLVED